MLIILICDTDTFVCVSQYGMFTDLMDRHERKEKEMSQIMMRKKVVATTPME